MGGYGSGRRTDKPSTDDCVQINLSNLKRLGMLKRNCMHRRERVWRSGGHAVAGLTLVTDLDCLEPFPCLKITGHAFGRTIDCLVWLDSAPMRFGGERWYALCPITGRRCTSLILPPGASFFAAVRGWGVPYASTRESELDRALRAIDKVETRMRTMSQYARSSTKERLFAGLDRANEVLHAHAARIAMKS